MEEHTSSLSGVERSVSPFSPTVLLEASMWPFMFVGWVFWFLLLGCFEAFRFFA